MKNLLLIIFYLSLTVSLVFAQENKTVSIIKPAYVKKIVWQKPQAEDLPGLGKNILLVFSNAQYDFSKHLFPIYSERTSIPSGTYSADIKIIDAIYEPLNDSEKNALNTYTGQKKSLIKEEINASVTISNFKKKPYAYVQFIPIRKNKATGSYEKLISFSLQINPLIDTDKKNFPNKIYASNSVLSNGDWYKISVTTDGIYKMNASFLKNLGMNIDSINTSDIRIYGNGGGQLPFANSLSRYDDLQENAIYVTDQNNNGKFDSTDYILFYGQAQHCWKYNNADKRFHHNFNIYSDSTYYFITADLGPGKRIVQQGSSTASPTNIVSSFDDYQFH